MGEKWVAACTGGLLAAALVATPAQGHAMFPGQGPVPAGSESRLELVVPHERGAAHVNAEIIVDLPGGWEALRCEATEAWSCEAHAASRDEPAGFMWTRRPGAPRAPAGPRGFSGDETFAFTVRVGPDPGPVSIAVQQAYEDGEVVAWDGPPESMTPAPLLMVSSPERQAPAPAPERQGHEPPGGSADPAAPATPAAPAGPDAPEDPAAPTPGVPAVPATEHSHGHEPAAPAAPDSTAGSSPAPAAAESPGPESPAVRPAPRSPAGEPAAAPATQLPRTGSGRPALVLAGVALGAGGACLVLATPRRRPARGPVGLVGAAAVRRGW